MKSMPIFLIAAALLCAAETKAADAVAVNILKCVPPTVRDNAAKTPMPASEFAGAAFLLNGTEVGRNTTCDFTYVIPKDSQLTTADIWTARAIDTAGQLSKDSLPVQAVPGIGPKSPPAAPSGLKITTATP
ncbi:MAG: hypothetical protein JWM78_1680 [Verrucomicrobiaceae bacterium]|nr:hypothetical protein [Verrucomicrobiaceae bacterium]